MPRSGIGLNDLLGRRRLAPVPAATQPLSRTVQQVWPDSLGLAPAATEARALERVAKNPHRQQSRGRFRAIVLVPKLHLSEADLPQDQLPIPDPRVRDANATDARGTTRCRKNLQQQCGNQGLTPSRPPNCGILPESGAKNIRCKHANALPRLVLLAASSLVCLQHPLPVRPQIHGCNGYTRISAGVIRG